MIKWLQEWYKDHCNGDWEHENSILIKTIDNPGWLVEIDLTYTKLESLEIEYTLYEKSEIDWIGFSVEKKIFKGVGDTSKLYQILKVFENLWESH